MSDKSSLPQKTSSDKEIDAFLEQVQRSPAVISHGSQGRLIFSLDATASRERTWDQACQIQNQMFLECQTLGGISIQLCHYAGFDHFAASDWMNSPDALLSQMRNVHCIGGHTQIARLLQHVLREIRQQPVQALVFVGDCVEEPVDFLCQLAGQAGLLGTPIFIFHEGRDITAAQAFRQMAKVSNGAYCRFDSSSVAQLRALLSAVAVYAAGGRQALEHFADQQGGEVKRLSQQLGHK